SNPCGQQGGTRNPRASSHSGFSAIGPRLRPCLTPVLALRLALIGNTIATSRPSPWTPLARPGAPNSLRLATWMTVYGVRWFVGSGEARLPASSPPSHPVFGTVGRSRALRARLHFSAAATEHP